MHTRWKSGYIQRTLAGLALGSAIRHEGAIELTRKFFAAVRGEGVRPALARWLASSACIRSSPKRSRRCAGTAWLACSQESTSRGDGRPLTPRHRADAQRRPPSKGRPSARQAQSSP